MTIYTWGADAPINKMEVHQLGRKAQEAFLHVDPAASPGRLENLPDMLRSIGLTATIDMRDGQYMVRVRGFESENFLAEALETNGFVSPEKREKADSPKKEGVKKSFGDKIREKSLKAAGVFYLIGDVGLIAAGRLRGDKEEIKSGLAYSSSSVVLARYGEKKADRLMDDLYGKLLAQLGREGLELPQLGHTTVEELGKPGGIIERIESFLYDHPAEVNNAINAYAGMEFFRSGLNQKNFGKQAAGALVTSGMLVGLLVPEKSRNKNLSLEELAKQKAEGGKDGEAPNWVYPDDTRGILKKAADYVQEAPLRTGGRMAMANNLFQFQGALADRKRTEESFKLASELPFPITEEVKGLERQSKAWKWNLMTAASYLVANGLLSISSKKASASTDNLAEDGPFEELYAAAASVLAGQPQEMRDELVNKTAYFLAEQKEISCSAEDLATRIHEKIDALAKSPWAARVQQAPAVDSPAPSR